jgi:hypothetical protein
LTLCVREGPAEEQQPGLNDDDKFQM